MKNISKILLLWLMTAIAPINLFSAASSVPVEISPEQGLVDLVQADAESGAANALRCVKILEYRELILENVLGEQLAARDSLDDSVWDQRLAHFLKKEAELVESLPNKFKVLLLRVDEDIAKNGFLFNDLRAFIRLREELFKRLKIFLTKNCDFYGVNTDPLEGIQACCQEFSTMKKEKIQGVFLPLAGVDTALPNVLSQMLVGFNKPGSCYAPNLKLFKESIFNYFIDANNEIFETINSRSVQNDCNFCNENLEKIKVLRACWQSVVDAENIVVKIGGGSIATILSGEGCFALRNSYRFLYEKMLNFLEPEKKKNKPQTIFFLYKMLEASERFLTKKQECLDLLNNMLSFLAIIKSKGQDQQNQELYCKRINVCKFNDIRDFFGGPNPWRRVRCKELSFDLDHNKGKITFFRDLFQENIREIAPKKSQDVLDLHKQYMQKSKTASQKNRRGKKGARSTQKLLRGASSAGAASATLPLPVVEQDLASSSSSSSSSTCVSSSSSGESEVISAAAALPAKPKAKRALWQDASNLLRSFFGNADAIVYQDDKHVVIRQQIVGQDGSCQYMTVVLYLNNRALSAMRGRDISVKNQKADKFHKLSPFVKDYIQYGVVPGIEGIHTEFARQLDFERLENRSVLVLEAKIVHSASYDHTQALRDKDRDFPGSHRGAYVFMFDRETLECKHACFHETLSSQQVNTPQRRPSSPAGLSTSSSSSSPYRD